MAQKSKSTLTNDVTNRQGFNEIRDLIDSFVAIDGNNLITSSSGAPSDPGVAGQLFLTGSDAFGLSGGYDVICISRG